MARGERLRLFSLDHFLTKEENEMGRTLVGVIGPTDGQPFDRDTLEDLVRIFEEEDGWRDVRITSSGVHLEYEVTADDSYDPCQ